ncbi:MAG: hypothetical protein HY081_09025 [Gammaproteobacteria bacterium]|nr:hypothetical protein [Gammaproteobacteria bacterium]
MFTVMTVNMRCPFEKTILSAQCACAMATRFSVAEQMGVDCRGDIARNNCITLLGLMRERARFVLKLTETAGHLPFGKEMKVMLGGLLGLQRQITPGENVDHVADIHALVQQAQAAYGSLQNLPYQEIVKSIAAFHGKRRGTMVPG